MLAFDLESLDHERQRAGDLELDYILGCSEARVYLTAPRSWWQRVFGG